jgi:hypothetical protein
MAKKKRAKYTSKGTGKSVSNARAAGGRSLTTPLDRALDKRQAWKEGRNPTLTVPNPNPLETNRKFIRVKATSVWGDPRKVKAFEIR